MIDKYRQVVVGGWYVEAEEEAKRKCEELKNNFRIRAAADELMVGR